MQTNDINIRDVSGQVAFAQVGGNLTGDIIAGNKTIITNIIQQAAKQIITAPYKFLASYDISDRDIFFGRNAVIEELVGKLPRYKTLVINGRSGSGKTSLINAGLIPRLAENGYQYLSFRDYSDPLRQLREHVAHNDLFTAYADQTNSLTQFLKTVTRHHKQHIVVIFDQFERFFVNVPPAARTQFIQEIKTCLASDLSGDELDLVFALREDFFGAFVIEFETQIPAFFNQTDRFNLLPLNRDEAREAILRPLKNIPVHIGYNLPFVDEVLLPGLMGESTGGNQIDPPHLQIVCNQLYESVRRRYAAELEQGGLAQIDRQLYAELGETSGILRTYLDDFIDRAAHRDSGGRDVLRSMLKLMLETTGTRKFVSFTEIKAGLPDVQSPVIEQHIREFQDSRIIETRGEGAAARYSLSHEVMVAKVESWFDERELERKRAQEILERGLAEWKTTQALLNAKQVEHIRKWGGGGTLNAEAEQLLQDSQIAYEHAAQEKAERERRLQEEEEARRKAEKEYAEEQRKRAEEAEKHAVVQARSISRIKKLAIGLVIFLIAALCAAGFAWLQQKEAVFQKEQAVVARNNEAEQRKQAETAKNEADIRRQEAEQAKVEADRRAMLSLAQNMSFQALDKLSRYNGPLSALLARQAYLFHQQYQGTTLSQMDNALQRVLEVFPFQSRVLNHLNGVNSVSFSPDGKFLASAGDRGETVLLWDVSTALNTGLMQPAVAPRVLAGHEGWVWSVAFSPDGKFLASSGEDKTVRIWDLAKLDATPRVLTGHGDWIWSVAFSPDGKFLASGDDDNTVLVWDLAQSEAAPRVLAGHEGAVSFVVFSPDGTRLASGSWDNTVRVWDLTQPSATPRVFTGYEGSVYSVVFSPDGKFLASGSGDKMIRIWDLTQPSAAPHVLSGHNDAVKSVTFSPDGKILASGGNDRTVRLWDISMWFDTGLTQLSATPRVLAGHENSVMSVAFSPDGKFLASGGDDHTVRLWDMTHPTGVPLVLTGHKDGVRSVAFSPNHNFVASGGEDKIVRVWDLTQLASTPRVFTGHEDLVYSVAFSPDGKFLASGSHDRTARVWDLTQPTAAPRIFGHGRSVFSVAFSPDGHFLASGSSDKTIRVWDLRSPSSAPRVLTGHEDYVMSVAFSPNNNLIASGDQGNSIRVWNLSQPDEPPRVLTGHEGWISDLGFSPDSEILASGSWDKTIRVWDLTQPTVAPRVLTGHEGTVSSVMFSSDGHFLASGSSDKTVRMWDLASPSAAPRVLTGYENTVLSVAFSPDAKFLTSGSSDGTVHVWIVRTEELTARICDEAGRNLTWDEWQQFIGPDVSYERTCSNLPVHSSVVEVAQNLAKANKIDEANAIFQLVLKLDASIKLDPIAEMNTWRAQGILEEGAQFASVGDLKGALAAYAKAQELDPTLNISAGSWNTLCWFGSLNGMAAEMLDACEQAVNSTQDEWEKANNRDSRGLARALTGNRAGAIEDFQAFMKWTTDVDALFQRQEWITALKKGENPFTPEVLEQLRDD